MDKDTTIDLLDMLYGIQELTQGMCKGVYSLTENGVLHAHQYHQNEHINQGMNAQDFVCNYYDLTCGAFRMISAATNIITRACTNDELDLVCKKP